MPIDYNPKTEFFITTKAELATEKVNEWLEAHYETIDVIDIRPFMSYTSFDAKGAGYMIGCMVLYLERRTNNENETDNTGEGIS